MNVAPLDRGLNAAILAMAGRIFPTGFDVSDDAPDTYPKLKAHLDAGGAWSSTTAAVTARSTPIPR